MEEPLRLFRRVLPKTFSLELMPVNMPNEKWELWIVPRGITLHFLEGGGTKYSPVKTNGPLSPHQPCPLHHVCVRMHAKKHCDFWVQIHGTYDFMKAVWNHKWNYK